MTAKPRPIAEIPFTDGARREVYDERDGRQYVPGCHQKVYGLRMLPDEPAEVVDPGRPS